MQVRGPQRTLKNRGIAIYDGSITTNDLDRCLCDRLSVTSLPGEIINSVSDISDHNGPIDQHLRAWYRLEYIDDLLEGKGTLYIADPATAR